MKKKIHSDPTVQQSLFIEQAEYIETDSFQKWSAVHPEEELILRKLSQPGAKLITGPRGCGKTTLLLKAFHHLRTSEEASAFAVYVNFKSSLRLEPFYKRQANAAFWFNQWMLYKIYQGVFEALSLLETPPPAGLRSTPDVTNDVTSQLELGRTDLILDEDQVLSIPQLEEDIVRILSKLDKKRCVLLLDDAAHAFSTEQQRDFFEFFRQLKSKTISPKAAIYPGVTIYSSTFHVGHDAEEINVWLRPESDEYLAFMFGLLERRLPSSMHKPLKKDEHLLTLMCYAAFGMPRALLNMVRSCFKGNTIQFERSAGLAAIKSSFNNTMSVFTSLSTKLPMYKKYIDVGAVTFDKMIESVKSYNHGKDVSHQSVTIAIRRPIPFEFSRVLGFFQYAGLLLPKGELSKGEKGVFDLYTLHYAALVDRNALFGRKAININDCAEALGRRRSSEFTRTTAKALLGTDDTASVLSLSLPPCQVCKTGRLSEAAKFCLNCGAKLKSISVFEALVEQDISELPLTENRVASIKKHSRIRTVKDILMDHDNRELRSVPRIGRYWAKRIYSYAEEHIA